MNASLPRTAWLVVALLVPVALLNYLDRQMLAAMKSSVMSDVMRDQPEADWGLILALFKWTYAFLSPIGGFVADRLGRRVVIVGSLFVWSVVTFLTGQVQTYEQLLAARAFMGISEAFYIPAALALISDYHMGPTRSRAVGLHQMGIYIGVILGGFSGYVADNPDLGWRSAFVVCGWIGSFIRCRCSLLFGMFRDSKSRRSLPAVMSRFSVCLAIHPLFFWSCTSHCQLSRVG